MLRAMADQRCRQAVEWRRPHVLMRQADGDDDAANLHGLAVVEHQAEAAPGVLDAHDHAPVDIAHTLALKPFAVAHEIFKRELLLPRDAVGGAEGVERKPLLRIGNVARNPGRAQPHPLRHVGAPSCHRIAEHAGGDLGRLQVGRGREPVRTRTDHGDFAVVTRARNAHHKAPQMGSLPGKATRDR